MPHRTFSKEPHPPKWTGYQLLALIFGTLLSSQGTDASFVLTLSGFPPGFASFCSFCSCVSDSIRLFRARPPVSEACLPGCWALPTP
ncbi:hypothetical protein CP968_18075 [Streptomyces subrutilus]|uniref:Uncharacterized protein n=1 Tax=Streptomyces subrutilus TaxID=36818 RepID=A0A5P2ULJ1_9ACTN|nr:hypothetical protein CP968_18075 [Streptomyces subrutilus]